MQNRIRGGFTSLPALVFPCSRLIFLLRKPSSGSFLAKRLSRVPAEKCRGILTPGLFVPTISGVQGFKGSRVQGFGGPRIPKGMLRCSVPYGRGVAADRRALDKRRCAEWSCFRVPLHAVSSETPAIRERTDFTMNVWLFSFHPSLDTRKAVPGQGYRCFHFRQNRKPGRCTPKQNRNMGNALRRSADDHDEPFLLLYVDVGW